MIKMNYALPALLVAACMMGHSVNAAEQTVFSDIVLSPEMTQRVTGLVESLKSGDGLKHILIWGRPGTGKTMLAHRIARASGYDCKYVHASHLKQFTIEEAKAIIKKRFEDAKNSSKKQILIVDEIESIAQLQEGATGRRKALFDAVLEGLGSTNDTSVVIALVNRPETLDTEFVKLFQQLEMDDPTDLERRAILQLHVDKLLKKADNLKEPSVLSWKYWYDETVPPVVEPGALSDESLDELSGTLEGFVGRDILKLVLQIQSAALASKENRITTELINKVVAQKLEQRCIFS